MENKVTLCSPIHYMLTSLLRMFLDQRFHLSYSQFLKNDLATRLWFSMFGCIWEKITRGGWLKLKGIFIGRAVRWHQTQRPECHCSQGRNFSHWLKAWWNFLLSIYISCSFCRAAFFLSKVHAPKYMSQVQLHKGTMNRCLWIPTLNS